MAYIPVATDYTEPQDSQKASVLGLEIRTLKNYIQTVLLPLTTGKVPLNGTGATGTWGISISGNAATATTAGSATTAASTSVLAPAATGTTTAVKTGRAVWANAGYTYNAINDPNAPATHFSAIGVGSGGFGAIEIGGDWVNSGSGLWYRALRDVSDNWYAWTRLIDASNVATYAPSLTGSGASGTWPINISGVAGTVAWTSVTGRPSALSQFINDIGAGGSSGITSFQGRTTAAAILTSVDVTGALGFTPYNSGNPNNYVSLAQVAAAGYQTSGGSVNYAASAGSISWFGVSSRPTNLSQFTNDLGDITAVNFSRTGITSNGVKNVTISKSGNTLVVVIDHYNPGDSGGG